MTLKLKASLLQIGVALSVLLCISSNSVFAQGIVPCDGSLYFTRQLSGSTKISKVNINSSGTVSVSDYATLSPNKSTNATVYYNGYIFTQDWNGGGGSGNSTYITMLITGGGTLGSYSSFNVTGIPNDDFNNAGIDKDGNMYILRSSGTTSNATLYRIPLSSWTPSTTSIAATTLTLPMAVSSNNRIWGDIAFDPITNRCYVWYHPSNQPASGQPPRGLYEIKNFTTNSPTIEKVGSAANFTMGTLFFNERGQLFSYGVPATSNSNGGDQKYFYSINLTTGEPTQLGETEVSPQSDGCECQYRLSLTLTAGENGQVDVPNCGTVSTFAFDFFARNTSPVNFDNINFNFELDPRFSFYQSNENLTKYFRDTLGLGENLEVHLTSVNGGNNNKLYIDKMTIPQGNIPFKITVMVASGNFTDGEKVNFQAKFGGLSDLYGEEEFSSDPLDDYGKFASEITFRKKPATCGSISGTVFNDPDGGFVNNSTGVENAIPENSIYALLLGENDKVYQSVLVSPNGEYSFTNITEGNYSVILSSTPGAFGQDWNEFIPPTGWAYTGTFIGPANTGNAGTSTGKSEMIEVGEGNVSNVNFGIQKVPEPGSGENQSGNPGGNALVNVPANTFTNTATSGDHDGGSVAYIRITGFPANVDRITINGVEYTADTWPAEGVTIPTDAAGNPLWSISIDPSFEGAGKVEIPFVAIDNVGAESANTGTAVMNFGAIISGSIFHDINGNVSKDALEKYISGTNTANGELSEKVGQTIYANIVDKTGKVIDQVLVSDLGAYQFNNVPTGEAYDLIFTNVEQTVGESINEEDISLPSGWVITGADLNGTVDNFISSPTVNLGVVEANGIYNLGLQIPPTAFSSSYPISEPAEGTVIPLDGTYNATTGKVQSPFGEDVDEMLGATKSFVITSLPVINGDEELGNVELYYNGELVTNDDIVNETKFTNPTLFAVKVNGTGYTELSFGFKVVDAAGFESTEETFSLTWNTALPVTLSSFQVAKQNNQVLISWATASEQNNKGFYVQRSNDGIQWEAIEFVRSKANNGNSQAILEYQTVDATPANGTNYYRLQQVDIDGKASLSAVQQVNFNQVSVRISPNPVKDVATITGLTVGDKVSVYAVSGALQLSTTATQNTLRINFTTFSQGAYIVLIVDKAGNTQTFQLVK